MSDTIEQPKIDVQRLLSELENSEPETVEIDGRKTSIGWLHKDTESRISHLMTRERIPTEKKMVMWYALVRLDTRYGLLTYLTKAVSWIYWRWLWYVKRERCTRFQMMVIAASKKKIQERSNALGLSIILMIEAMDTMMTRAAHEAGQAGRGGG